MKVLIVEDEIMAQKSLTRTLTQNFPDLDIVGMTGSVNMKKPSARVRFLATVRLNVRSEVEEKPMTLKKRGYC